MSYLCVPAGLEPTCTNEHVCFVNDMKAFETLDAEVLGVSVDSVWSHKASRRRWESSIHCCGFSSAGAMSEKYGVYWRTKDKGRRSIGTKREGGVFKNYDIRCAGFEGSAAALGSEDGTA